MPPKDALADGGRRCAEMDLPAVGGVLRLEKDEESTEGEDEDVDFVAGLFRR